MPDWPIDQLFNAPSITTVSDEVGLATWFWQMANSFGASNAWPSANLAIFTPFEVYNPITIVKISIANGTAVSGNVDVGIYNPAGKRLVSIGSTAQSGTSSLQTFDITDTLLQAGGYYMGVAFDNTTATIASWSGAAAVDLRCTGLVQAASSFALPDPVTFATYAQTIVPYMCLHQKSTV